MHEPRSILAIVLEVTSDGFYRLGTRDGVLKQLYARSQFTVCQKKLLQIHEVPADTEVALRTVAKEQSTGTGQEFLKCVCKTKCQNKKDLGVGGLGSVGQSKFKVGPATPCPLLATCLDRFTKM
ncbi:hypothetical protein ACI65C_006407 [Semiaphis heraclei]